MKKIICTILILTLTVCSLTSCLLTGNSGLSLPSSSGDGDTVINVSGGNTYGSINITSTASGNLLAASKALLSAVSVRCTFETTQGYGGFYSGTSQSGAAGSGVIYQLDKSTGDAYIITNYHVVYNAKANTENGISNNIKVYLYGMEMTTNDNTNYAIPAEYVGGSMYYDIAVLKVTGSTVLMSSNARAADIANSDEVTILDTAIAIGNPGDSGISATVGNINVDSEEIYVKFETTNYSESQTVQLRVLRTDAAVNSGNSGGGLFNDRGELIGIVNAKDSDDSVDNIGYAIPSNVAKAITDNVIYYSDGTVKRCMLGVTVGVKSYATEYDVETGKIYKIEEVVISELTSSSAVKSFLKVGDVINSVTVDGKTQKVTRTYHLVDSMLYARVGSTVVINVTRDGTATDVSIPIVSGMLTTY